MAEGGDGNLRYKLSKESVAKTLSLLMQTNFSGRAEIGLTGDDNLHCKVSPEGNAWREALLIDAVSGGLMVHAKSRFVSSEDEGEEPHACYQHDGDRVEAPKTRCCEPAHQNVNRWASAIAQFVASLVPSRRP